MWTKPPDGVANLVDFNYSTDEDDGDESEDSHLGRDAAVARTAVARHKKRRGTVC